MPIRIVCPSCSAALSVKDEYAGRAVKCPKCGGVIPASQSAEAPSAPAAPPAAAAPPPPAPPPEPQPEPARSPFEELDEPAKPAKAGPKITGRPQARARDEDEDDRPRRRGRDEDEEDRPRRRSREADEDEDRPRRRGRDEDERGERGERGARDEEEGGEKARKGGRDRDDRDRDEDGDDRPARRRRREDDDDRPEGEKKKGGSGATIVIIICSVLLLCCVSVGGVAWWIVSSVKKGVNEFVDKVEKSAPRNSGPAVEVKAADLAKAFKDEPAAAETKYKDKNVLVEGKLLDLDFMPGGTLYVRLEGLPPAGGQALGTQIRCSLGKSAASKAFTTSRGQALKVKGKCAGLSGPFVDVLDATIENTGSDPAPKIAAAELLSEYGKDAMATDEKYKEKAITITDAFVDSKQGDASVIVKGSKQGGGSVKIKVTLPFDIRDQVAKLKPGERIKEIHGEYAGGFNNVIGIDRAWLVP